MNKILQPSVGVWITHIVTRSVPGHRTASVRCFTHVFSVCLVYDVGNPYSRGRLCELRNESGHWQADKSAMPTINWGLRSYPNGRRGRFTAPSADLSASCAHDQMKLLKSIIGPRWLFWYPNDFVKSHNRVPTDSTRFQLQGGKDEHFKFKHPPGLLTRTS